MSEKDTAANNTSREHPPPDKTAGELLHSGVDPPTIHEVFSSGKYLLVGEIIKYGL